MGLSPSEARRERVAAESFSTLGGAAGIARSTAASMREIWAYSHLVRLLTSRELRARYKNSSLGILWSLGRPLIQLAIYFVAIGQFLGAAKGIPDFALFVFAGLTIWGLFSEMVSAGTVSIVANSGIVKKVYLPREIFPIASTGSALFNFGVQFAVLLTATLVFMRPPRIEALYLVPLSVLVVVIYGLAAALVLSATNVYLRDVEHLVEIGIIIFFWLSPIVYSFRLVTEALQSPWLETLYLSNPITLAVLGMQRGMWSAGTADASQVWPAGLELRLLAAAGVGLIALWLAQRLFAKLQSNFAQEL